MELSSDWTIQCEDASLEWRVSSVGTEPGYGLHHRGSIPGRIRMFPSRTALRLTKPPIQCAQDGLSSGVKLQGREAEYSPPSNAEIKNDGDIRPLPRMSSRHCAWLIKHNEIFTLYLYIPVLNNRNICRLLLIIMTCCKDKHFTKETRVIVDMYLLHHNRKVSNGWALEFNNTQRTPSLLYYSIKN
jgi:hypothetical protein